MIPRRIATLIASVRRRVDEGYSAESDLLRFETEAARLDIDTARATVDLERSLGALGVTIGASVPIGAAPGESLTSECASRTSKTRSPEAAACETAVMIQPNCRTGTISCPT